MSWYRALPINEFGKAYLYRYKGNNTWETSPTIITWKNHATDEKGIARGERTIKTQIMSGVTKNKKHYKIFTTAPVEIQINDKIQLFGDDNIYHVILQERHYNSVYFHAYAKTGNKHLIPQALELM